MASLFCRHFPQQLLLWLILFAFLISIGSSDTCNSTVRHRKPWHSLSKAERLLFVTGYQKLKRRGILDDYVTTHAQGRLGSGGSTLNIHSTSQNFFWHSYFLWEFETDIRNLGGDYACFALPYWDVTHDAEWIASNELEGADIDINDLPIYSSDLGADGVKGDTNYCVVDKPWTVEQYTVSSLCSSSETNGNCCLKRYHVDNDKSYLSNRTAFGSVIFQDKYAEFGHFTTEMSAMHQAVHYFVGGVNGTHFSPINGEPMEDPLFALFHAFIDYIRLMKEDCADYDLVNAADLDDYMPYSYEVQNCSLDYSMDFDVLCDDETRFCSTHSLTPRLMYDLSPNRGWNVVYELGDFWNKNTNLRNQCKASLNETWWRGFVGGVTADDEKKEEMAFVNGQSVHTEALKAAKTTLGVTVFMVIAVAVMAVLQQFVWKSRRKKENALRDDSAYGAL